MDGPSGYISHEWNLDKAEADKIQRKVPRFWLSEDWKLYKHLYLGPYLLCIHPEVVEVLLEELHKGICGSHMGGGGVDRLPIEF